MLPWWYDMYLRDSTNVVSVIFYTGTAYGSLENPRLTFSEGINLKAGVNEIALLSIAVGLQVRSLSFSLWFMPACNSIGLIPNNYVRKLEYDHICIWCSLLHIAWFQNVGPHFETWNTGVLGPVSLSGLKDGKRDLTWQKWTYKVSDWWILCLVVCILFC